MENISQTLPAPDPVRSHLAVQVAALQAQELRRPDHVSARLVELFQDELPLEALAALAQRGEALERIGGRLRIGPRPDRPPNLLRTDDLAWREDYKPLDDVFQLAHV